MGKLFFNESACRHTPACCGPFPSGSHQPIFFTFSLAPTDFNGSLRSTPQNIHRKTASILREPPLKSNFFEAQMVSGRSGNHESLHKASLSEVSITGAKPKMQIVRLVSMRK